MDISLVVGAAISAGLAVVSVALWTLRVALTAAGRRLSAAGVAGLEAVTFTVAFGRIVANLDNLVGVVAYAGGVGLGTWAGMRIEERFSSGQSWVRIMVEGCGERLTEFLRWHRWPVTALRGVGPTGPVTELVIAVDDALLPSLLSDLDEVDPDAFRAVERLRSARGRALPDGMRQVGAGRRHSSVP